MSPAVFISLAFGFLAHAVIPGIPVALAVARSVLGLVLAVTQSGWLSIFMAAVLVAEPVMLVILCIAVLRACLLVTGQREVTVTTTVTA